MILFIDTSNQEFIRLSLKINKKIVSQVFVTDHNLSERLVPEIAKFLKKRKIQLNHITQIKVQKAPGAFSRMRTAVATANALVYALNLPQKLIKPSYSSRPNITFSKSKIK